MWKNYWTNPKVQKTVVLILLLVVGVVLASYGGLVLVPDGQREKQNIIYAVRGTLKSPYTVNVSESFTVSIGTLSTDYTVTELADGIDLTNFIHLVQNGSTVGLPVQISFTNNTLLVSAEIKNAKNETLVYVTDNDWKAVSPQSVLIWDRNYNAYAFELIDQDKIPALQILMEDNNKISIGFNLYAQGILIYFGITTGTYFGSLSLEDLQRIRSSTLFKYPSSEYPNEMMNSTGNPSSDLLSAANAKIHLGIASAIIGSLLATVSSILIPIVITRKEKRQAGARKKKIK